MNNFRVLSALLLLSALILAGLGCRRNEYSIVLLNVGEEELTEARVSFDGFRSVGGVLVPGKMKAHMGVDKPIPSEAIVEWKDLEGRHHRVVVEVGSLPRGFTGTLYFEIDPAENKISVHARDR